MAPQYTRSVVTVAVVDAVIRLFVVPTREVSA
jgi:hypothetical protein